MNFNFSVNETFPESGCSDFSVVKSSSSIHHNSHLGQNVHHHQHMNGGSNIHQQHHLPHLQPYNHHHNQQTLNRSPSTAFSVVKVNSDLLPVGYSQVGSVGMVSGLLQSRVSTVLDAMGQASALAQDLRAPITSGSKLRMQDEHTVYFLIDRSCHPSGAVVGLLKVGKKNLFLVDGCGSQKQVYPLCVLDFYVHESRQRLGCGRLLFEAMLADKKVAHPRFLAIDRPSPKLLGFLRKHYSLTKVIHQVNNYVIFEGFFTDRPFDASPGPKRARIYMGKLQYV